MQVVRRLSAVVGVLLAMYLVTSCGSGPYQFSEMNAFVDELNPGQLGEVVSDETLGSDEQLATPPARNIEILADGDRAAARAATQGALAAARCEDANISGCYVTTGDQELHVRSVYFSAGERMPSGEPVPSGTTGIRISMTY